MSFFNSAIVYNHFFRKIRALFGQPDQNLKKTILRGGFFLLKLLICIAAGYWLYQQLDMWRVKEAIISLSWSYVALFFLIFIFIAMIHSLRFVILSAQKLTTRSLIFNFQLINIANFINIFVPMRGGDIVRTTLLHQNTHHFPKFMRCMGVLLTEKGLEVGSFVLIFITSYMLGYDNIPSVLGVAAGAFVCVIPFMVLATRIADKWLDDDTSLTSTIPTDGATKPRLSAWLKRFIVSLSSGLKDLLIGFLHTLGNIKAFTLSYGVTFGLRMLETVMILFILQALNIDLSFPQALVVYAITFLSLMVPGLPGFIGTFHAAAIYAVSLYGISLELATAYALVAHLALLSTSFCLGLICILTTRVKNPFSVLKNNKKLVNQ